MQDVRLLFLPSFRAVLFLNLLLVSASVSAAAYLKLGDIKGEARSSDGQHNDWIVITSVSWPSGRAPTVGSTSRARGGASPGAVTLVKTVDASSPSLQQACADGRHYPEAILHVENPGGNPDRPVITGYMLYDVTLSCTAGNDGRPSEEVSLNFGRVEVEQSVAPVTARPTVVRPQRVTPKPIIQGPQTGND